MKYLIAIIFVAALVAACAPAATDDTGVNTPSDEGKLADKTDSDSGSSASAEFLKLVGAKANLEWKVAYDITSTANGESQTVQMTQYFKGEKKIRMDSAAEGVESQIYMVNNVFTMCSKQDGAWTCYKIANDDVQQPETEQFETQFEESPSDYGIYADGTKQVAGVTATCFKVTDSVDDAVVRYCFKDGVPLYMKMESKDATSEMIATSYSKSVADSDFVPPAAAQDLSALYGGAGGTSPAGGDACSYCDLVPAESRDQCLASC